MNIYGEVVSGVCVNVVVAESDWVGLLEGEWILSTETNVAWIGATVVDGIYEVLPKRNPDLDEFVTPESET